MTRMEAAIVFPLLPGKRLALEQFVSELTGERRDAHDRFHVLVTRESWFLQPTPQGDLVIVYLESPDPAEVFAELAVSHEPFVLWFRARVLDLTGMDLTILPPFCLPTRILHRVRAQQGNAESGGCASSTALEEGRSEPADRNGI